MNPDSGAANPILAADSVEQATSIISDKLVICGKRKLKLFLGLNSQPRLGNEEGLKEQS